MREPCRPRTSIDVNARGRSARIVPDRPGIENGQTFQSAKEKLTACRAIDGISIELHPRDAVRNVERSESPSAPGIQIGAHESAVRSEPETTLAIFLDGVDDRSREPVLPKKVPKGLRARVEAAESDTASDPDHAIAILVQRPEPFAPQFPPVRRLERILRKRPRLGIERAQAEHSRTEPDPIVSRQDRLDLRRRQHFLVRRHEETRVAPARIVAIEPEGSRDPEHAAVILGDRIEPPEGRARRRRKIDDLGFLRPAVEPRESILGTHPQRSAIASVNRPDHVVRNARRVTRNVPESLDATRFAVEPIEPAAEGPDPDHPVRVHPDGRDRVGAQRARIGPVVFPDLERFRERIPPTRTAERSDPDRARAIFEQGASDVL